MDRGGNREDDPDVTLSDEAIEWLVRLHSGHATADDESAFAEWRAQSAGHDRAAREAEALWHGIGLVGDEARETERKAERAKVTRRVVLGGGALVVAGVAIYRSGVIPPSAFADYATGIGEQRTVALSDGSTVRLNAGSALSLDFAADRRWLRLLQGQATFTVAPDARRPFVVDADGGQSRAIGTVFDVDIRSDHVVVTVVEGIVSVSTRADPLDPVMASAGYSVQYAAGLAPSRPEAVDAEVATAWRRGKLIFNRRRLGDVVAELERYRGGRILVVGDRLRALEVTGVFDLDDPEAVLSTIEATLPVHVVRLPLVTIIR
ncbi:FecR domain-containing protein [Amorphus sp. 3PC139-8]|uniref:FecR family protein n=1 Tax=Amorphus sp. 3PC139-8 TaxID=2735676 RepID=UPI00345D49E6